MRTIQTKLVMVLAASYAVALPVTAGNIQINDASGSYNCNVGSAGLTVDNSGNVTVAVGSCSPSLASTGGDTGGTGGDTGGTGGDTGGTGGDTGGTGGDTGGTGGGTSTAANDPGSGLWMPSGTSKLYVVDPTVNSTTTYLPGCINGQTYSRTCEFSTSWTNGQQRITLEQGNVIALRYRSAQTVTDRQEFTAAGWDSGNLGRYVTLSLSQSPGDFSNSKCTNTSNTKAYILTYANTSTRCKILPNTNYYLNIRMDSGCSASDTTCRFQLRENSNVL